MVVVPFATKNNDPKVSSPPEEVMPTGCLTKRNHYK